jgi:hypothetical protein
MHKSATKCNETLGKWYKNKHGASKIIDTSETYHSLVSLGEEQIAEGDEIQEKLDTEVKAFKMHNSTRDFATRSSDISKRVHQLCVIITEVEEENKNEGNKGVGRQVDKIREHNKKEKEKIHVSAREWRIIMSAINHGTEVPRRLKKRSSNGISVHITPAQEETERGKRHICEKSR